MDVKEDGCSRLTNDYLIDYSIEEVVEMFGETERDTVLKTALQYLGSN